MESSKGSSDALNTLNASAPTQISASTQIDAPSQIGSAVVSSAPMPTSAAAKPSKYSSMLKRSKYPSRWRLLTSSIAVIVSVSIMLTYFVLDCCDILPGPLTLRVQHISTPVSSPRTLLPADSAIKGISYGKTIDSSKAQQIIDKFMSDPSISDNTSVIIMDAKGKVVASHEADTPREPASTLKTLTAAVASRTLDMGSTLDTQVFLQPKSHKNPKKSSSFDVRKIVLRGNGDMLLGVGENDWHHTNGRAGLTTLASRTANALKLDNISEVSLEVDDSLFGAKRAPALVYETDNERRFYAETSSMAIDDARQRDLALQGVDPDNITDFPLSDPTPALSVGNRFAKLLVEQGIKVQNFDTENSQNSQNSAIPVSKTHPLIANNSKLLAKVSSAPLNEVMAYMLRISDNTLAEEFGRLTALAVNKKNSPEGAVQAVEQGLRKLKVDISGLHMSDCSGLSPKSRVRVATLAKIQVLNLQANSGGAASSEGLSLPGLVGTARKRLTDVSNAGLMRVKTGSLDEVSSMTGNVSRKSGGALTFAVVANQPIDFWGAFVAINKFMGELPNL